MKPVCLLILTRQISYEIIYFKKMVEEEKRAFFFGQNEASGQGKDRDRLATHGWPAAHGRVRPAALPM